jgi:hypothetical protein
MKRRFISAGLLTALLLAAPALAADKKKDTAVQNANPGDYQALADAHTVTGKLLSVNPTDKTLSLRVDYPVLEPNPKGAKDNNKRVQHLLREQQAIMRTRNPLVRALKLQQFEVDVLNQQTQAVNKAFKVVNEHKEFDLTTTAKVVVRFLEPPVVYDDKGNLKKYTAAELKELKGKNPDLPGYTADFSNLQTGQTVRVTLVMPKPAKDKDKDAPDDKKPQVSMIVIVADAPMTDSTPTKGKDKKNK